MFADPRRRNLAIFTGVVAIAVLLAWIGLHREASQVAPKYVETEFLPGFAAHVREAARIHVVSKKHGTFDVVFRPSKGWVILNRNDYPASYEAVNKTLVGLAALQTIEPKTSRADWLHYIGLDAPPQGDGTAITVSDDHGHVLAALIAGKSEDIGDPTGAVGLFVRHPNDTQSWLARAVFEPLNDPFDWMDKTIIDIDSARIMSATVDEAGGQSFEVQRGKPGDPDFHPTMMPPGREMANAGAADGIATAIAGLTFDDVKPAKEVDFTGAVRTVTKTFDGMSITADIAKIGSDYWARFGAMNIGPNPDVGKQARAITERVSGWAYKLPEYKGAAFMTTGESLFKPKTAPAKK